MRCARCGICCLETDMLLSAIDIRHLEKKGYSKESFTRFDKNGYVLLRNRQGHCVFYNSDKRGCDVYSSRPLGCRVYPIIQDEETGIFVDSICHAQDTISQSEKERVGKRVLRLLERIDAEAKNRRGEAHG
jgi:Fe-S-cluster containining protein